MWWEQPSSAALSGRSNLENLILSLTPTAPCSSLPLGCSSDPSNQCQPARKNKVEYFRLKDLWRGLEEPSAFGVGSPVILNSGEEVTQYYIPYLSAIQIYLNNKPVITSRNGRENGHIKEFESDSLSEESGSDKLSRSISDDSSKAWDATSSESSQEQDGTCPNTNRLGRLVFQFFEKESPYSRCPLYCRICELAENYPALMTLKSVDISPASWISIAWYPIYRIPCGNNDKELSTCFLAYHTLSSSFQDVVVNNTSGNGSTASAEVGEAKEGKPEKTKVGEVKEGKPENAEVGEAKEGKLKRAEVGEAKEGKPRKAEVGEARQCQLKKAEVGEAKEGKPKNAEVVEAKEGKLKNAEVVEVKEVKPKKAVIVEAKEGKPKNAEVGEVKEGKLKQAVVGEVKEGNPKKGKRKVSLPPFGLTTYKMQGDLWVQPDTSDQEKLANLHSAADSWLKQLNVSHHDFDFFNTH